MNMECSSWRIFIFLFFGSVKFGHCTTFSSVTSLYDFLTTNKYRYIRPETDLNTATNVNFKFFLVNLQDLDDNKGLFSVTGFFEIAWYDRNRAWDPALYGGTWNIRLPTTQIWKPHIIIGNPYKKGQVLSLAESTIRLHENGEAYWHPSDNYQMACDADVSFFPFDSQTCEMMVIPWQNWESEIAINLTSTTVDVTYYNQNPTWDFVRSNLYVDRASNSFYVSMTFKRKPTFFMINIIFPIILLGFLNMFVFILPSDSGERVGFGITLLLAIAVFMTIVADALPSTSSPRLSSVGIFLCIDLIISTLMMVCTIFGLVIHHRDDKRPVTMFWIKFMKACNLCKKLTSNTVHHAKEDKERLSDQDCEKENHEISWKDVSSFLDIFFIVVFSVILFVANFAFFLDIIVGVNK